MDFEFFFGLFAGEGLGCRQLSAAFVFLGREAGDASLELWWFLGEDLLSPRYMNLADEVSQVLVLPVSNDWSFRECWCYVWVGVENVPVLVDNALDGW